MNFLRLVQGLKSRGNDKWAMLDRSDGLESSVGNRKTLGRS